MEFRIGTQFSREFSFEESTITNKLNEGLNKWFSDKKYYSEIQLIYVDFICVSKGFEPFFMARPLKVLRKELAIVYEIKLDFENFFYSTQIERLNILKHEFITQSEEILNSGKIKNFNTLQFIEDVKKCFNEDNG